MKHIVIAIDGPSASGKGTLARRLAHQLGYAYLDTGALYRCVGKAVLESGGDPSNEEDAVKTAQAMALTLKPEDTLDPMLRNDTIGQAASKASKFPAVRQALFDLQRNFAAHPPTDAKGVVLDGRDIGTIICPDANVKLFVTAETDVRSKRRFDELSSKGIQTTYDAVLADMKERDTRDSNRDTAPLKPAEDAHILDTTNMREAEVMDRALAIIRNSLAR